MVGSDGVASPIDDARRLLRSASRGDSADSREERRAAWAPGVGTALAEGGTHRPRARRDLESNFTVGTLGNAESSMLELAVGTDPSFPSVLLTTGGLVVTPAVRLLAAVDGGAVPSCDDVVVLGHPSARCVAIVAIRGELALLRLRHLFSPASDAPAAPVPVGPPGDAVAVGQLVASVDATHHSVGFVSALNRRPGTVAPAAPPLAGGCGTVRLKMQRRFHREYPPVTVTAASVHDADGQRYGSLLVDRRDQPVALQVGGSAPGIGFAIPWSEVLSRFGDVLALE